MTIRELLDKIELERKQYQNGIRRLEKLKRQILADCQPLLKIHDPHGDELCATTPGTAA